MTSDFSLKGKVAIVTGGARGIGYAISKELVRLGAKVVIADSGVTIEGEHPDASIAEAAASALGAVVYTTDIAAQDGAPGAVRTAVDRLGSLDIVVNNAAILRDGFIFKSERVDFERVMQNNLVAAWALLAAATPVMRDAVKEGRAPGRIVNMISSTGLYGNLGQSAYAAAKAGLVGLTRVVAMEMARSKVNCNAVAPFAATRVTESIRPANAGQEQYKTRALAVPADYVARLVAWLCAPACGVTGQIFGVRGREVFLFSQPRPVRRLVTASIDELSLEALEATVLRAMGDQFVDLATDLETFNTEPVL